MSQFRFDLGQLFLATTLIACGCGGLSLVKMHQEVLTEIGFQLLVMAASFSFIGAGLSTPVNRLRWGIVLGGITGCIMGLVWSFFSSQMR